MEVEPAMSETMVRSISELEGMREGARARRMLLVNEHQVNRITEEEERLGPLQDEETSPVTIYVPSPPPSEEETAEVAEDVAMMEQPSSHRAREPTMVERPSSHKATAPTLMRPTPKTLRKKEAPKKEEETSKEEKKTSVWEKFLEEREKKTSEGKSDSYEIKGNDPRGLATLHGSESSQERCIEAQEGEAGKGAEAYGGAARRSGTEWATSGLPHRTDPERQASLRKFRLADLDMSPLRRVMANAREQRDRRPLLYGLSETSSRVPPDVGAAYREPEELHGDSAFRTGASPAGPACEWPAQPRPHDVFVLDTSACEFHVTSSCEWRWHGWLRPCYQCMRGQSIHALAMITSMVPARGQSIHARA